MVLSANIFSKAIRRSEYLLEYRNMDYRNAFLKLSDYQNTEYWATKLGKLSDY